MTMLYFYLMFFMDACTAQSSASGHDCYVNDPLMSAPCSNPLLEDKKCVVIHSKNPSDWDRMDCDIVVFNVPARRPTSKWLVIHAGGCDTDTEHIGDYFAAEKTWNYFGLRPCAGLVQSKCIAEYQFDVCLTLHMSWVASPEFESFVGFQGFNPPELMQPYRSDPQARFVFLHEYGDGLSYSAWMTFGCDDDEPTYVCINGDDPNYDKKWEKMYPLLTRSLNNLPNFPCRVVVVDARNSTAVPGYAKEPPNNRLPGKPCSGMYPPKGNVGWAWEMSGKVTAALASAIRLDTGSELKALADFRDAIDIALGNDEDEKSSKDNDDKGKSGKEDFEGNADKPHSTRDKAKKAKPGL
eukprot:gb/GEZN01008290.1/.p1 GENE.gb/GEZN01008290.1/~~gb/GEZN01008290.1/.p1  ORF type:complete len:353 (+),score=39.84 gb/GEZN01008290.1/:170-1228(+)